MTPALERSGAAAIRVLESRVRGAEIDLLDLELAAWTAGCAGRQPPALPDRAEDLHVRQAAAFGAGDDDAGLAIIGDHMSEDLDVRLLFHACHLVGHRCADRLIELAERDRRVWFSGSMLARTRDPVRLLRLVDHDARYDHVVATVCELVIRGRETKAPVRDVEDRWTKLNARDMNPGYLESFRSAQLRLAAREDMEAAITMMQELAEPWGYDGQDDGTMAVLARLVRTDPERACHIVASREDPANRVAWLDPLVSWFELPAAAEPIVDELLALDPLDDAMTLASLMIVARSPARLERALAKVAHEPADALLDGLPLSIALLRDAGLDGDADAARDRVFAVVGDPATRDRLEALSGPGRPPLVPWRPDPGVP